MTKKQRIALLELGLSQIPARDLRRLKAYIEAGKPLLFDGAVVDPTHSYG